MATLLALGLPCASCLDYRLRGKDTQAPAGGDSDARTEICSHVGTPDAGRVAVEPACTAEAPPLDPWNLVVEWRLDDPWGSAYTPAVAPLIDTTSDGRVDSRDMPMVAAAIAGSLVIADGATGTPRVHLPVSGTGVAIADVAGDAAPEVLLVTADYTTTAWSADGNLLWEGDRLEGDPSYGMISVADLDGDGAVECVADRMIVDGASGATRATTDDELDWWRSPVVADLDRDGVAEILLKDGVYSDRGDLLWRGPWYEREVFSAPVNADDDLDAEVIFVGGQDEPRYALADTRGEVLVDVAITSGEPGPPCIADMDGDGVPEVGIPGRDALIVVELDGTIVWSLPVQDPSGLAGCAAADLDLDGAAEIVYADEHDLRIVSGRTGEVHATMTEHESTTIFEYPVIADVDLDGAAEIVLVSYTVGADSDGWHGVTVIGHADNAWPRAGSSWPIHDFAPGRVKSDGSLPSPMGAPWLEHNMFRAMPTAARVDAADLRVAITDVCVSSCDADGEIVVAWQVANHGAAASAPDVVELLAVDAYGASRVLASAEIPSVAPGEGPEGSTFRIAAAEAQGLQLGLTVRDGGDCFEQPHRFVGEMVCP